MRSELLAIIAALSVLSVICAGPLYGQTAGPPERTQGQDQHLERQQKLRLLETLRNEGIHEAAKLNGGEFVSEYNLDIATRARPRNLDELARWAPVVVLGTVQSAAPRTTRDGSSIETLYEVLVTETLRGPARGNLTVHAPGGRMEFPDGAVAEVRTPGFSIRVGGTYLLFVRPLPNEPDIDPNDLARDVHVLGLGPQGVFDMSSDRVQSLARADNLIRVQYDGRQRQAFLTDLRAAIQKAESTSR